MGKRPHSASSSKGKRPVKDKSDPPQKKKKQQSSDPTKEPTKNDTAEGPPETWSKSKKKRIRMLMAKQKKNESGSGPPANRATNKSSEASPADSSSAPDGAPTKASNLQNAFKARLSGSRFRILNEELYTTTSKESYERFSNNPELFEQYHEGFRHQVESWPVNPVDVIVKWLSNKYQQSNCVVADFGCGDAQLAKDLLKLKQKGKTPFEVHSFDLISPNELVTACDMASVPLKNKSVDVCVFCLALMGTNLADFVREAHRVLKDDGKVKIAEVRSRIEYSHSSSSKGKGSNEGDAKNAGTLSEFVEVLKDLGFKCTKTDRSNKMFLLLELEKSGEQPNKKLEFSAKPCIYKRR